MTSRWKEVPLDIIRQEFQYLYNLDDIMAFCADSGPKGPLLRTPKVVLISHIFEKLCKNTNGEIWKYLYQRDLTDDICLNMKETLKDQYLEVRKNFDSLSTNIEKLAYISKHGYEKLLSYINFTKISQLDLNKACTSS